MPWLRRPPAGAVRARLRRHIVLRPGNAYRVADAVPIAPRGHFRCGPDPQWCFTLRGARRYRWFRITARGTFPFDELPQLFLDIGEGWTPELLCRLTPIFAGADDDAEEIRWTCLFRAPGPVRGIRFDPRSTRGDCTFELLDVEPLPAARYAWIRARGESPRALLRRISDSLLGRRPLMLRDGFAAVDLQLASDRHRYGHWIATHGYRDERDRAALVERLGAVAPCRVAIIVLADESALADCAVTIRSVRQQVTGGEVDWRATVVVAGRATGGPPPPAELGTLDRRVDVRRMGHRHPTELLDLATAITTDADWQLLLHPGDTLAPNAVAELAIAADVAAAGGRPVSAIYTDEDTLDAAGNRSSPWFKPAPSLELARATGYLAHAVAHRSSMLAAIGGRDRAARSAHEYDLMLRVIEAAGIDAFLHVPNVLVHRRHPGPPGTCADRAAALREHLTRQGTAAEIEPSPSGRNLRVRHHIKTPAPLVSIIIPTRDRLELLRAAVESAVEHTTYQHFEVLVLDNDSVSPETERWLTAAQDRLGIRVIPTPGPFNFSQICNTGVAAATGEIVALLNNDIQVVDGRWLDELVSWAQLERVGAVGAMLRYPDATVQHAGVIMGLGGAAGHSHRGAAPGATGYFDRLDAEQNLLGVTAACLVMRAAVFHQVGGFDPVSFPVALNDVDLCLRVADLGYDIVWTPATELVHYEGASRGSDHRPAQQRRARAEAAAIRARWSPLLDRDPFYSPHLTRAHEDFSISIAPRAPTKPTISPPRRAILHAAMPAAATTAIAAALAGYDDGRIRESSLDACIGDPAAGSAARVDSSRHSVVVTSASTAQLTSAHVDALAERFDGLTVFGFVRAADDFARAAWQRALWSPSPLPVFDDLWPHYRDRFERWYEWVDPRDVHLLPYLPAAWPSGCAVHELARRLGLGHVTDGLVTRPWTNSSDAAEVSAVLYAYRTGHLARHGATPGAQTLAAVAERAAPLARRRLRLSTTAVDRMAAANGDDLAWMAEHLLSGEDEPAAMLIAGAAAGAAAVAAPREARPRPDAICPTAEVVTIGEPDELLDLAASLLPGLRRLAARPARRRRRADDGAVGGDETLELVSVGVGERDQGDVEDVWPSNR